MEGVGFTVDDFHAALDKYDFNSEIGTKVRSFCSFLGQSLSLFIVWCLPMMSKFELSEWVCCFLAFTFCDEFETISSQLSILFTLFNLTSVGTEVHKLVKQFGDGTLV